MGDVFKEVLPEFGRKKKFFYASIAILTAAAIYPLIRKADLLFVMKGHFVVFTGTVQSQST